MLGSVPDMGILVIPEGLCGRSDRGTSDAMSVRRGRAGEKGGVYIRGEGFVKGAWRMTRNGIHHLCFLFSAFIDLGDASITAIL